MCFVPMCLLKALVQPSRFLETNSILVLSLLAMALIVYSIFNKGVGVLLSLYRRPVELKLICCIALGVSILQGLIYWWTGNLSVSDWRIMILMGIIGPFVEEILFRGIILNGLLTRYKAITAIVSSALLFALVHIDVSPVSSLLQNITAVAFAFAMGCVLGLIFYKTKSLLSSSILHCLVNLLGLLIEMLFS